MYDHSYGNVHITKSVNLLYPFWYGCSCHPKRPITIQRYYETSPYYSFTLDNCPSISDSYFRIKPSNVALGRKTDTFSSILTRRLTSRQVVSQDLCKFTSQLRPHETIPVLLNVLPCTCLTSVTVFISDILLEGTNGSGYTDDDRDLQDNRRVA